MKYYYKITPDGRKEHSRLRGIVNYDGKTLKYKIAYVDSIPGKWNNETRRCELGTKHGKKNVPAHVINKSIALFETAVVEFFIINEGKEANNSRLKAYIDAKLGISSPTEENSVLRDYETFIRRASVEDGWAYPTIQKHRTLLNDLKAFCVGSLKYSEINNDFLSRFSSFLTAKGNRNETANKKITHFKWFIHWCKNKGICGNVDIENYDSKLRTTKRPVVFLSYDELQKIYSMKFQENQKYLERARDFFCFQCFTSLRFSDMIALKKSSITKDTIHAYLQKTGEYVDIELNEYSRAILEKYKNNTGELALPVPSQQKVNEYIKEVCKIAEIDEPVLFVKYIGSKRIEKTVPKYECISTHAGRRTFICTALALGIPVTTVMEWTGHSSFNAMKPYISASSNQKRQFMSMFDILLDNSNLS